MRRSLRSTDRARASGALGLDANLGYATLQAAVDLMKSHTDVPRVPVDRKSRLPRD